jgi:ribosomal protein S18 acetylase RimI-like enzyme
MWCELDRELPEPVWPDGISLRTFEPSDAEAVHALLDEAYRGWDDLYVPIAHEDWVRTMVGDLEFDPKVWFLAERDGVLAGCSLHWESGWLKDIAVREPERGHGLGRALVLTGLHAFAARGVLRVGLKVNAENPTGARKLYESVGYTVETLDERWARKV